MINFFKQNRLIYEQGKEERPRDPGAGGGRAESVRRMDVLAYLPSEENKETPVSTEETATKKSAEQKEKEAAEKTEKETAEAIEKARKAQEEKEKRVKLSEAIPVPVTDKAKEKWENRIKKEVYGDDEELMKQYSEKVKDAIEQLDKDALYGFIFNHTPAGNNRYEKSEYTVWNREFAELINHYLGDLKAGSDETQKHQWIVGGLQNYLFVHFIPKNVFQAEKNKSMTNPFIYTDGKLGCYTVSVMAEYWNDKYGKGSNKQPLGAADLDETYAKEKKTREIYDRSLVYLNNALGKTTGPVTVESGIAVSGTAPTQATTPATGPTAAPAEKPTPAAAVTAAEKPADKETKEQPEKFNQLKSMIFAKSESDIKRFGKIKTEQIHDYTELRDKDNMDPDTWFLNFDDIRGSAPDLAFQKYKEIYKRVKDEGRNPANDSEVIRAFGALGTVIDEYYLKIDEIVKIKKAEYDSKIQGLIDKYDLPNVLHDDRRSPYVYAESPYYRRTQSARIFPESLRSSETRKQFIESYFIKEFPTKKLQDINDLKKYLKEPKDDNLKSVKDRVINDDKEVINRLNELILFRNMYSFDWELKDLTAKFNEDFQNSIKGLDRTLIASHFPAGNESEKRT